MSKEKKTLGSRLWKLNTQWRRNGYETMTEHFKIKLP